MFLPGSPFLESEYPKSADMIILPNVPAAVTVIVIRYALPMVVHWFRIYLYASRDHCFGKNEYPYLIAVLSSVKDDIIRRTNGKTADKVNIISTICEIALIIF
jgi:hypothetical protein